MKKIILKKKSYRPEIDGLRAFAVTAVIINHFNKDILPGGYLGVDIFFVISGFVITSSIYQRPSKNFKNFISGFYERRIRRLLPALSVFILITSIGICLFNPNPGLSIKTGLTSLFGLSNLYLFKISTDYFAQSTELNIFTHTWSLGVEEQFYILYPFLIWFSGFGRQTKNGARNLFLSIGALTIASLIGFIYLYPTNQPAAYFLMTSRFWEISAGCLIFIGFQKFSSIEQFLEKIPPLLVLALIISVMYLPISLGIASTITVVILSAVLIASLKRGTAAYSIFTNPKIVYIGLISYSLYLWHWGVLALSRWTIGVHFWSVPFQVALIFGISVASYKWIETPFRKNKWFGKIWKTFIFSGGLIVMLSGSLITLGKPLKGKIFTGKIYENKTAYRYMNQYIEPNSSPEFTSNNCHDFFDLKKCYLQADRKKTIYFLGNSHANQYRETAYLFYKNFDIGVFSITTGWCNFPLQKDKFISKNCRNHPKADSIDIQKKVEIHLKENASKGDIVIISNRFPTSSIYGSITNPWLQSKQSIEQINNLFNSLSKKGVSLILLLPSPEFNIFPELCAKEWFRPNPSSLCSIEKSEIIRKQQKARKMVKEFLEPGIHIFDPVSYLCDKKCTIFDQTGKAIYWDNNHITDYANKNYIFPNLILDLRNMNLL